MARGGSPSAAATEEVKHVPLGGSLTGQSGDRYYRRLRARPGSAASSRSRRPPGLGRGDRRAPTASPVKNGEEVGTDQQGWYRFKVTNPEKDAPYYRRDRLRPARPEQADALELLLLAHQGRFALHEPWAGGNGRVDTMQSDGRRSVMVATPGGYIAPGQDIIRAGANGLLETPGRPRRHDHLVPQPLR